MAGGAPYRKQAQQQQTPPRFHQQQKTDYVKQAPSREPPPNHEMGVWGAGYGEGGVDRWGDPLPQHGPGSMFVQILLCIFAAKIPGTQTTLSPISGKKCGPPPGRMVQRGDSAFFSKIGDNRVWRGATLLKNWSKRGYPSRGAIRAPPRVPLYFFRKSHLDPKNGVF